MFLNIFMGWFDWIKQNEGDKKFGEQIDGDLRKYEKEEKDFERKKKSMKYLYEEFFIGEFSGDNKKSKKIKLKIDIYSDKKLTKRERNDTTKSNQQKFLLLRKLILSAQKGEIVLKGETHIQQPKKNLITIVTKY